MLTLIPKGVKKRTFLIDDFFHLPPMSTTPEFTKKFETVLMVILRGLGETESRKNLKLKISCYCPFYRFIPFLIMYLFL